MMLEFNHVSVEAPPGADCGLDDACFALAPGALAMVQVDAAHWRTPLADLAGGLLTPASGEVRWLGESWGAMSADRAAAERGRIGRVFAEGGWLSNLDVDENLILAARYHTSRPDAEILEEARALGRRFGLDPLPSGRPHTLGRRELRRAQWVRAWLGAPRLLLLDHPADDLESSWKDALVEAVNAACAAGTTVLWITANSEEWSDPRLHTTLKFVWRDRKMSPT